VLFIILFTVTVNLNSLNYLLTEENDLNKNKDAENPIDEELDNEARKDYTRKQKIFNKRSDTSFGAHSAWALSPACSSSPG